MLQTFTFLWNRLHVTIWCEIPKQAYQHVYDVYLSVDKFAATNCTGTLVAANV